MTREDFARAVSTETGFTIKDVKAVLGAIRKVLVEELKKQETVKFIDGITFESSMTEEYEMKSPRTGETLVVPARIKPRCKFGTTLKRDINE